MDKHISKKEIIDIILKLKILNNFSSEFNLQKLI